MRLDERQRYYLHTKCFVRTTEIKTIWSLKTWTEEHDRQGTRF